MKRSRKLIGAAAFSAALAGGGVAGALLGAPGTSGAQDGTTSTTTAAAAARPHPAVRRAAREVRQARRVGLDTAAKVLGMTPEALRTELQGGKSIADVAKEKGVDLQKVVDALVAEGKARLEAEITKLPDQVAKIVEHKGIPAGPGGRGGPGGPGRPAPADAPAPPTS